MPEKGHQVSEESRKKIAKGLRKFHRGRKRNGHANGKGNGNGNGGMRAPGRQNGLVAAREEVDAMSTIVDAIDRLKPRSRGVVLGFVNEHFRA